MPSNHLILCHPLLLRPSIFPSITVFSNGSVLHIRWPKYCNFSFSISPSNEYLGLISFRIDWFDLLAVQGILKSLLQHHNLKASILQLSAFFMVQSVQDWKNHNLTVKTSVGKVTSPLFNTLSRFVIALLPRSKPCHHVNLTFMQSTSCEMLGWMNHKLESRLPGEISTTSDMQRIPP